MKSDVGVAVSIINRVAKEQKCGSDDSRTYSNFCSLISSWEKWRKVHINARNSSYEPIMLCKFKTELTLEHYGVTYISHPQGHIQSVSCTQVAFGEFGESHVCISQGIYTAHPFISLLVHKHSGFALYHHFQGTLLFFSSLGIRPVCYPSVFFLSFNHLIIHDYSKNRRTSLSPDSW